MTAKTDLQHMQRALTLARSQAGRTGKNPSVGCVIIDATGIKISEGATGDGGADHAEALALQTLKEGAARGGTAFVTLEPCRERSAGGKSCSELLLASGVSRVVCAIADAHPNGSGGFDRLRNAGLDVDVGLMEAEATEMYADFFDEI
ncbi:MAG: bifunctional diaminohydroxyphosphoribosylaminopyrimidine deaminase/5-amino-6-(5-phosphoribosylamino)uracil reductase RibD [Pseudomonadota bacterium]